MVAELNHIVFAFGHLNAIKYFRCANNHKLKCLLLDIFSTVSVSSFMTFGSVYVFLIKPSSYRIIEKRNIREREREREN